MVDYIARIIAVTSFIVTISKILYDVWKDTKHIKIQADQGVLSNNVKVIGITIHNKSNLLITILGAGILFTSGTVLANGELYTKITKKKITWLKNRQAIPIEFPIKFLLGDPIRLAYPLTEISNQYKKGHKIEMIYCWDSERKIYSCHSSRSLEKWINKNL